jgi:hypothetical protein
LIDTLRKLLRRAGPDRGNVSCAAPQAPNAACVDGDAPLPSTGDSATPTTSVDEDIELMRYLLLSMVAAY